MDENIPEWLNINDWQWLVHQYAPGILWTEKMDYQVRRYMDGQIQAKTAGVHVGQSPQRVMKRAKVLMIKAQGRIG